MILVNLLSAVQIVLESFPVSSSGNVELLMGFLSKLIDANQVPALCQQFLFFLHGPTIIILGIFFFKQWRNYFVKLFPFTLTLQRNTKHDVTIYPLVIFGFITNVITVFFYALNNYFELTSFVPVPLWLGFLVTTLLLFSTVFIQVFRNSKLYSHSSSRAQRGIQVNLMKVKNLLRYLFDFLLLPLDPTASRCSPLDDEWRHQLSPYHSIRRQDGGCHSEVTKNPSFHFNPFTTGVLLGLAQSVALFVPGISRFASTFVVGRWIGFAPAQALEYSFLIEFPLITAGFLKGLWWMIKTPEGHAFITVSFVATLIVSTILGYLGLMLIARLAEQNKIWLFGFYTGLLAIISFVL